MYSRVYKCKYVFKSLLSTSEVLKINIENPIRNVQYNLFLINSMPIKAKAWVYRLHGIPTGFTHSNISCVNRDKRIHFFLEKTL